MFHPWAIDYVGPSQYDFFQFQNIWNVWCINFGEWNNDLFDKFSFFNTIPDKCFFASGDVFFADRDSDC